MSFFREKRFTMTHMVVVLTLAIVSNAAITQAMLRVAPSSVSLITFTPGTTISAGQVNQNFQNVAAAIDAINAKLQYVTVESNPIDGMMGPHFIITGANVHIRSGSGWTDDNSSGFGCNTPGQPACYGLGNLVVGYNPVGHPDGDIRTGSHNIVVGDHQNFLGYGGLIAGWQNQIESHFASVTGGAHNRASESASVVSGGDSNHASGWRSVVSGGKQNLASGSTSAVSGGYQNEASGNVAWVGGGYSNDAVGQFSSVSGGETNDAEGESSSVSGGINGNAIARASAISGGNANETTGVYSSVTGGLNNLASFDGAWVGGGESNRAVGKWSSVSGGEENWAAGENSSVTGGLANQATGKFSSVSGGGGNVAGSGTPINLGSQVPGVWVGGGENNQATSGGQVVLGGFNIDACGSVTLGNPDLTYLRESSGSPPDCFDVSYGP